MKIKSLLTFSVDQNKKATVDIPVPSENDFYQIAEKMKTTTYVIKYALKRAVEAKKVKRFFNPAAMKERVSEDGCQIGVYALLASSLDRKNLITKKSGLRINKR